MPDQGQAHPPDGEIPPSVDFGDEARKLISTVQEWAQRALPAPPSGHGGPECQWCPICQVASILRGDHPEITERVVEAGTAVAATLRSLLESATPGGAETPAETPVADRPRAPANEPPKGSKRPRPRPRTEHPGDATTPDAGAR